MKPNLHAFAHDCRLPFKGSDEDTGFWNKGISACAVCDGAAPMFRNNPIAVIGGGDSGGALRTHPVMGVCQVSAVGAEGAPGGGHGHSGSAGLASLEHRDDSCKAAAAARSAR